MGADRTHRTSSGAPAAESASAHVGTPGRRTLTESLPIGAAPIQRKASHEAGAVDAQAAFAHATSGPAGGVPYRAKMEAAFATSFGDVRAHLGGSAAQEGLAGLGAHAAAHGRDVAFRDASPSESLVAHELAHVVQQRAGGGVQCKPTGVSEPSDDAEHRADAAAEAVVRGDKVGDLGVAPSGSIHRAIDTNGGSWTTPSYTPSSGGGAVGDSVGAHIELHFKPNDLVEAPANGIGLIQTVKTFRNTAAGGAVNDIATPVGDPAKPVITMGAGEADPGRSIDRVVYPADAAGPGGRRAVPNTSPMYGVHNSAAHISGSLTDGTPSSGATQFGSHVKKTDGTFDTPVDAVLEDGPTRVIRFAGQQFEQSFEVAALVLAGPLANTYLGSVEWGWKSDASQVATLQPNPVRVVQTGAPTSQFMAAAKKWNDATFADLSTGTVHNTVDVPLTTVSAGSVPPASRTTADLIARIATVTSELATLAAGVDRTNKEFEKTALEAELRRRNMKVSVTVVTTEDWGADEVYVKATGPGGAAFTSPPTDLNNGQHHDYLVPLARIWPVNGPINVKVYDEDWPDGDDLIVHMEWPSPYAPFTNTKSYDGANYQVTLAFDR